jgi:hypothetical protein
MPTNRKDLIRNLKQAAKNNTLMTTKHNPNNLGTAMKGFRTVLSFDLASNLNSFIDSEDFRVYSYIRVRKSSLEKELKSSDKGKKGLPADGQAAAAAEELSRSGQFISDRGASPKIILEHLALTLPIF